MKTAHILATLTCSALAAFSQSTIAGPADLDPTFGLTGTVMTAFTGATSTCLANSVAVQTDGKILTAGAATIGGSVDFGLIRYNPDGTLDTSFNGTGMVTTDFNGADDLATCLAVQTDGKIVVAGRSANRSDGFWHWVVVRYNADGSLDTGFGSGAR